MTREIIPIEAKNAGTVHILAGTVTDVDIANNKVNVNIDSYGSFSDIPVFYHCEDDRETANGMPFLGGERVVIVNYGSAVTLSISDMKVVGFEDGLPRKCPVETVYVVMKVKGTEKCFVWKVEDGGYAAVNKNDGDSASFPCDPADISNWKNSQKSVGKGLLAANNCGRSLLDYGGELPACITGDPGTAGSTSDSKQEPSDCEGCNFIDTAECSISWDITTKCYWNINNPEVWRNSGNVVGHLEQHILWGCRKGFPSKHYGSRKIEFLNNSEIKDAFRVEIQSEEDRNEYASSGCSCSGVPCDNIRLDSEVITKLYEFHTPIAENIFQITFTETGNCNSCADTGIRNQENVVVPMQLKVYGAYSEKIIIQAYFVEIQTITRSANCNFVYGTCFGSGCVGNGCPWAEETFTCHGLKMVAQANVLDDTDGIDPTGLPRNNFFEDAINELYNVLRVAESIPSNEIAGARFTGFNILKGV
ncbi:MAG: hypothetical protein GPJ50_08525 [Candidatus Heimdallarchaeota archaeon]|nr:hypothetical protein [Candidatus Heimdallarchaeota archaeon]